MYLSKEFSTILAHHIGVQVPTIIICLYILCFCPCCNTLCINLKKGLVTTIPVGDLGNINSHSCFHVSPVLKYLMWFLSDSGAQWVVPLLPLLALCFCGCITWDLAVSTSRGWGVPQWGIEHRTCAYFPDTELFSVTLSIVSPVFSSHFWWLVDLNW